MKIKTITTTTNKQTGVLGLQFNFGLTAIAFGIKTSMKHQKWFWWRVRRFYDRNEYQFQVGPLMSGLQRKFF